MPEESASGATVSEDASGEPVVVGAGGPTASDGEGATLTGRAVHKYAQTGHAGPRNQPRRTPKSKR